MHALFRPVSHPLGPFDLISAVSRNVCDSLEVFCWRVLLLRMRLWTIKRTAKRGQLSLLLKRFLSFKKKKKFPHRQSANLANWEVTNLLKCSFSRLEFDELYEVWHGWSPFLWILTFNFTYFFHELVAVTDPCSWISGSWTVACSGKRNNRTTNLHGNGREFDSVKRNTNLYWL